MRASTFLALVEVLIYCCLRPTHHAKPGPPAGNRPGGTVQQSKSQQDDSQAPFTCTSQAVIQRVVLTLPSMKVGNSQNFHLELLTLVTLRWALYINQNRTKWIFDWLYT